MSRKNVTCNIVNKFHYVQSSRLNQLIYMGTLEVSLFKDFCNRIFSLLGGALCILLFVQLAALNDAMWTRLITRGRPHLLHRFQCRNGAHFDASTMPSNNVHTDMPSLLFLLLLLLRHYRFHPFLHPFPKHTLIRPALTLTCLTGFSPCLILSHVFQLLA